jgi:BioD-like phosphotransacetylase family protein
LENWREELTVASGILEENALYRLESKRALFLSSVAASESPCTAEAVHMLRASELEVQDEMSALATEVVSLRRREVQVVGALAETLGKLSEQRKNRELATTLKALQLALPQVRDTSLKCMAHSGTPMGSLVSFMDRQAPVVCAKKLEMCW